MDYKLTLRITTILMSTLLGSAQGKTVIEGSQIYTADDEIFISRDEEIAAGRKTELRLLDQNVAYSILHQYEGRLLDEPFITTIFAPYDAELTVDSNGPRVDLTISNETPIYVKSLNTTKAISTTIDTGVTVGTYTNKGDGGQLKVDGTIHNMQLDDPMSSIVVNKGGKLGASDLDTDAVAAANSVEIYGSAKNTNIMGSQITVNGNVETRTHKIAQDGGGIVSNIEGELPGKIQVGKDGTISLIWSGDGYKSDFIKLSTVSTFNNTNEITLDNYGKITATDTSGGAGTRGNIAAVRMNGTINNFGTISSNEIAVSNNGRNGRTEINNYGTITGAITNENTTTEDFTTLNNSGTWVIHLIHNDGGNINELTRIKNSGEIATTSTTPRDVTLRVGELTNSGTIDVRQGDLTIEGKYYGDGGTILTKTELGDDSSLSTKLIMIGETHGQSKIAIQNSEGEGDQTKEGITVVKTVGIDDSAFTLAERVVAGAYEYTLMQVAMPDGAEWRLTSTVDPGPVPPGPVPPGPVPPGPTPKPVHKFRPEVIAYAENMRQANTLFMTDSDQRRTVGEYADPMTGRTEPSSLWLSQSGGHSTRHDASGQLKSDYNHYVMQLGGTVLSLPAGDDGRLEAGVQAGYGHARGDSRSGLTGYRARGTVSGYSTGIYGTWRQHREGQSGAYVSTTLQYSWLKNQVKGDDLAAEKYDARGTTLSLEGGYDLAVWQDGAQNGDSLFIRPRAQVTRMGVKADEHSEANGTRVSQQGDGNVFSHTGVRMWLDKAVTKTQRVQPFVEANWLHNTRDFCSSMNGVRDCQAGNRDQAEVLAGVTGDVSRNVAVTAQAGGQFGSQASRDLAGTLNVSVKF